MRSVAIGVQGDFYRLDKHNRSIWLAPGPDKASGDVIVVKGGEHALEDCPLEDLLRRSLAQAMESEARATLSLEPRLSKFTGSKSLSELLEMFQASELHEAVIWPTVLRREEVS